MSVARSVLGRWLQANSQFERKCNAALSMVSYTSARWPFCTLGVCLLVTIISAAGLMNFETESSSEALWVDQESSAMENRNYEINIYSNAKVESLQCLIEAKNAGSNALTKEILTETFELADDIKAIVSSSGLTFEAICDRRTDGECYGHNTLRFWESNQTLFLSQVSNDADVLAAVSNDIFPDTAEAVILRDDFVGGRSESNGKITSAPVFRIEFRTAAPTEDIKEWEEAVLDKYVDPDTHTVKEEWKHIRVYMFGSTTSLDMELARSVSGDVQFMAMSYCFLAFCCSLMLGQLCRAVRSRISLGVAEFFLVFLGIVAGYSVSAGLGYPFTSLQLILPFILVGIGVDDAFVIAGAFDRTDPDLPVEERVRAAILREGMSVTLTSLTDIVAFAAGSTASFPAVQYFCIYAAISVCFLYVYHLTAFCALVALDARRQEASRVDVVCCLKVKQSVSKEDPANESFAVRLMVRYTHLITSSLLVKLIILAGLLSFTGICAWQAINETDTTFLVQDLAPDESYMRDYFETESNYWGIDSSGLNKPTALHFRGVDVHTAEVQAAMAQTEEEFMQLSSINENAGVKNWRRAFTSWAVNNQNQAPEALFDSGNLEEVEGQTYLTGPAFYQALRYWVDDCNLGCNFKNDIIFNDDDTAILDSRIHFRHTLFAESQEMADAFLQVEDFWEGKQDVLPGTFVHARPYIFYHQYGVIYRELLTTTVMCFLAVVAVSIIILAHPLAVVIVFGVVFVTFVDLLGCIPLAGVSLNSISMINLVMAIGLVVDYSMHVAHSFMNQSPELNRNERTVFAMKEIGTSVAKGVLSTFIAILPLGFASSEVFRTFFKLMVAILTVGGAHGLLLMPVLLSIIGPETQQSSVQEDANKEDTTAAETNI